MSKLPCQIRLATQLMLSLAWLTGTPASHATNLGFCLRQFEGSLRNLCFCQRWSVTDFTKKGFFLTPVGHGRMMFTCCQKGNSQPCPIRNTHLCMHWVRNCYVLLLTLEGRMPQEFWVCYNVYHFSTFAGFGSFSNCVLQILNFWCCSICCVRLVTYMFVHRLISLQWLPYMFERLRFCLIFMLQAIYAGPSVFISNLRLT